MTLTLRSAFMMLIPVALMACDNVGHWLNPSPPPAPAKHAKPAVKTAKKTAPASASAPAPVAAPAVEGDAYIEHLSLANIALAQDGEDSAPSPENLSVIETYGAQTPAQEQKTILVLDYQAKAGGKLRKIMAPANGRNFPGLLEIMTQVPGDYTLHDLYISTVTLPPGDMLTPESEPAHVRQSLIRQQEAILATGQGVAPLDDARVQLRLIRFFIQHHFRDAAYLAADNVKQLLAVASQGKAYDAESVKPLSRELESLEFQLHKSMPYNL